MKTPLRANLRGVSAASKEVVWASGTNGTLVVSNDGGVSISHRPVPGGEALDFRDIEARSLETVYVMSSGPGDASRIYKTQDGGRSWRLQLTNPDKDGFFDAIAFWDDSRGLVLGDPVNGRFMVRLTTDGGETWTGVQATGMPEARPEEAAFAASGTCLTVAPGGLAWFVTGGAGGGRVFRSRDWGATWTTEQTPIPHPAASSGLFSIAATARGWIAVGGDYRQETRGEGNVALGPGSEIKSPPPVYLSAVVWRGAKEAFAVGPRGTFRTTDSGETWQLASEEGFHTISISFNGGVYAAGARGRIARWVE